MYTHGVYGFKSIPGFSNYVISESGVVLNWRKWRILQGSVNPDGYCNFRLRTDSNTTLTIGKHRLLALAYLKPDHDITDYVVNHIDGDKTNNSLDNLEWVTHQGNIEHAGLTGLTTKCKPIETRDYATGKVNFYPSVVECSRFLNLTKDAILHRLGTARTRVFPEGLQYRYYNESSEWVSPDINISYGVEKPVLVRDINTLEVSVYKMLTDAADALNVAPSTVTSWLKAPNQLVPSRGIQIMLKSSGSNWVDIPNVKSLIAESGIRRKIHVFDSFDNSTHVFKSMVECAQAYSLSTTVLHYRLNSNRKTPFNDGRIYSYFYE